jgi:hypothetical protein
MPIENYVLDYFVIGVIPSLQLRVRETERSHSELFFCHSERSASGVKNLLPYFLIEFLRSGQRFREFSPQNDGMSSRQLFPIGNFWKIIAFL